MQLETTRLILKEISILDIDNIHELHSSPETDEYNTLGIPQSLIETGVLVQEWLKKLQHPRSAYIFTILTKDNLNFIGLIGLNMGIAGSDSASVWFKIHLNYWHMGYTTEALKRTINFCFDDLKLHRVEANCSVENIASIKILEKSGMSLEGKIKKNISENKLVDNYSYAIIDQEFQPAIYNHQ